MIHDTFLMLPFAPPLRGLRLAVSNPHCSKMTLFSSTILFSLFLPGPGQPPPASSPPRAVAEKIFSWLCIYSLLFYNDFCFILKFLPPIQRISLCVASFKCAHSKLFNPPTLHLYFPCLFLPRGWSDPGLGNPFPEAGFQRAPSRNSRTYLGCNLDHNLRFPHAGVHFLGRCLRYLFFAIGGIAFPTFCSVPDVPEPVRLFSHSSVSHPSSLCYPWETIPFPFPPPASVL